MKRLRIMLNFVTKLLGRSEKWVEANKFDQTDWNITTPRCTLTPYCLCDPMLPLWPHAAPVTPRCPHTAPLTLRCPCDPMLPPRCPCDPTLPLCCSSATPCPDDAPRAASSSSPPPSSPSRTSSRSSRAFRWTRPPCPSPLPPSPCPPSPPPSTSHTSSDACASPTRRPTSASRRRRHLAATSITTSNTWSGRISSSRCSEPFKVD